LEAEGKKEKEGQGVLWTMEAGISKWGACQIKSRQFSVVLNKGG
jgi:hypothetical protein